MSAYDRLALPDLASAIKRLVGFLVDLVMMTALAVLSLPMVRLFAPDAGSLDAISALTMINVVIIGVYQVGFVATVGQTPGKMIVRTKVVDSESYGIPSVTNAVARFALPMAAGFVPILGIALVVLVYGWLAWDDERQGLHDKLAHTLVVEARWANEQKRSTDARH